MDIRVFSENGVLVNKEHLMRRFALCLIAFVVVTNSSLAAPEPAVVQPPGNWTLDVRFENLGQFVYRAGETSKPERHWYIILTLVNKSEQDVDFYPSCELVTDTFQVLAANKGTSTGLFDKLKARHQGKYPYLELLESAGNKILEGEDNTKDILILWPDFDPNAKSVKIYISGLSNETVAVDHPTKKDDSSRPLKVYLRKTLELSYSISGDPALRANQKIAFVSKRWVMR